MDDAHSRAPVEHDLAGRQRGVPHAPAWASPPPGSSPGLSFPVAGSGKARWSFRWRCRPTCWPTSIPIFLGFGGPVEHLWQLVAGPQARIFSPHSYLGATLVMTLDTFPFVYLLSRSALLSMNVSFEEVSRASGISRLKTLWLVTLPLMRPSIAAGLALVILYVVSDFGAVSLLRYQTLTYAVFQQMTGRSDNTAASILSLLLVGLALLFLSPNGGSDIGAGFTRPPAVTVSRNGIAMAGSEPSLVTGYLGSSSEQPSRCRPICLIIWSLSPEAQATIDSRFFGFLWNSGILAACAATGGVLIGLPLAYLASRRPTWLNLGCLQAAYAGYVLPGPVAALAVLVLFQTDPLLLWIGADPHRGLCDPFSARPDSSRWSRRSSRLRRTWKKSRARSGLACVRPGGA